ncbi:endonuclease/exonuclease/phosphatase family protein [Carboxylicivirga litoralis]|uniref:endonuclease/exonuclease/phosphatase family protein n=1 Tax=Carboxylicivirga litoralis TaxID=2816963 RepID=UPI0021CB4299|nr:endonuclease/exonuclease/phosphatase family protein [Carboxylicivirga sp. A043]
MLKYRFVFVLLASITLLSSCFSSGEKNNAASESVVIGFYNLENLFDTIDTPEVRDEEFTPKGKKAWDAERYEVKLANMSAIIGALGDTVLNAGPAIIGLCEVENRSVLEDLVNHPNLKAYNYQIVHQDSPDKRGIDVALLYRSNYFKVDNVDALPLYIYDQEDGARVFTRDQLLVSGQLKGEQFHVVVNHWPSRYGGEERSRPSRKAAAQLTRSIVDSLQTLDKDANIIVMGDLNDDPNNVSVKDELRAVVKNDLSGNDLYNPLAEKHQEGVGTLCYRGYWNMFDQIIISQNLLNKTTGLRFRNAYIYDSEQLREQDGKYKGYPLRTYVGNRYMGGYSDHFPVFIVLE